MSPGRERTPLRPGRSSQVTYDSNWGQGTAAVLEGLVFIDGARRWLDHAACGDVDIVEAAVAAQLLCARAELLGLVAA